MTSATETLSRHAFLSIWKGVPLESVELERLTSWDQHRIDAVIGLLIDAGRLELGERGEVVGAHGVTLRETRHRISHTVGAVHTWCAFDAVGIPAALGIDADVSSSCPTCERRLEVAVRAGVPEPSTCVVWLPTGPCDHVMADFCAAANLFCSPDHLEDWRHQADDPQGEVLRLEEVAERGTRVWADVWPMIDGERSDLHRPSQAQHRGGSGDD